MAKNFETYEDIRGKIRWRLIGDNYVVIAASSQGFHDEAEAKANARRVYRGLAAWLYYELEGQLSEAMEPFQGLEATPELQEQVKEAIAGIGIVQEVISDENATAPYTVDLEDKSNDDAG